MSGSKVRQRLKTGRWVCLLPLAFATAGCAANASPSHSSLPTFTIKMNDQLRFVPARVVVPRGTDALKLVNVGSIPHNLDIPALGVLSPSIPGGQSVTVTIHATKAGSYAFDCDVHAMDGMVGTLVVR
jgi:plastocyanin